MRLSRLSAGLFSLRPVTACVLSGVFILSWQPTPFAQGIDEAYRVELTRLQAEKNALQKALRLAKRDGNTDKAKLGKEIESLTRELTRLRADNAKLETLLPEAERMHSLQEQERIVDRRKRQIETWLETHGVALPGKRNGVDANKDGHQHPPLGPMVSAALKHVEEHGQLWVRAKQEYFRADGIAAYGPVLWIAEVGAIALDDGFTPLELAADGSLRVGAPTGLAPVSHGESRTVSVVLFDPDDIRPSLTAPDGWSAWIDRGGAVMWAIAFLALLAVLVFLERVVMFSLFFLRVRSAEGQASDGRVSESDQLLQPIALIQSGTGTPEELEAKAVEAVLALQPVIRRGISLLAVVASVAPLLGLLGTVTGMIGTFGVITEHGTGDPRLLSGGISEALLTTQFGLMVAIPALLLQTTLYRSGDAILRRIETLALAALDARIQNTDSDSKPAELAATRRTA